MRFSVKPEVLKDLFSISTPLGESVITRPVYTNCPISVFHKINPCDLIELEMVDFDVILGMDWLYDGYVMHQLIVGPEWSNFSFQMSLFLNGKVVVPSIRANLFHV